MRLVRLHIGSWFGREQRRHDPDRHQRRHAQIRALPADVIRKVKRAGAGGEIANAPTDLGPCRQHRLLLGRAHARDPPTVQHKIERCARDPERQREPDCPPDPMTRITERDPGQHGHHREDRDDQPTAPPAEHTPDQRRIVLIEKRRPDELELVGQGQFAQQADRRQRHACIGQPGRLRRIGQQERHAGRKAQAQRRSDPPVLDEGRPERNALGIGTCDRRWHITSSSVTNVTWITGIVECTIR